MQSPTETTKLTRNTVRSEIENAVYERRTNTKGTLSVRVTSLQKGVLGFSYARKSSFYKIRSQKQHNGVLRVIIIMGV